MRPTTGLRGTFPVLNLHWHPVTFVNRARTEGDPEFHIIAHNEHVQRLMDQYHLAWGTQYEIARGVCEGRWKWEDVTEDLVKELDGSNQQSAGRVSTIIRGDQDIGVTISTQHIWSVALNSRVCPT